MKKTKEELKEIFVNGERLTEEMIHDLLDSVQEGPREFAGTNPREGEGFEASIDTVINAIDGTKWVKRGESDTDWEQMFISENGEFVANIELEDISGTVPPLGTIGRVGTSFRIGDGETENGIEVAGISTASMISTKVGEALIFELARIRPRNEGNCYFSTIVSNSSGLNFTVRSSTGYARLINPDGSLGTQAGTGGEGNIPLTIPPGNGIRAFGVLSVADGGSVRSGNLRSVILDDLQINNVDVSGLSFATTLNMNNNKLTDINLSGLNSLTDLRLHNNQLTSVDLFDLVSLVTLRFEGNQLTSLDLSNNSSLTHVYLEGNQLTSINLSGLSSLLFAFLENNKLMSVDLSGLSSLREMYCHENLLLESIIFGASHFSFERLYAGKLPLLNSVTLPNGCFDSSLSWFEIDFADLSGAELDKILISLAASEPASCMIWLSDNTGTRTSLSDDAVDDLISGGATITL